MARSHAASPSYSLTPVTKSRSSTRWSTATHGRYTVAHALTDTEPRRRPHLHARHGLSPDDLIQHGGRHRPDQRDKIEAVDRCWTIMTGQPYSCAELYHVEATECSRRPFVTCWTSRCRSFSLPWAAARRRSS